MSDKAKKQADKDRLVIKPPNIQHAVFTIVGTAALVMNRFGGEQKSALVKTQELGEQARKNRKRDPKDFDRLYEAAKHVSTEGWLGFPASAFRAAAISACRVAGFAMTKAKLSVFVEADGYSREERTPLVKLTKGTARQVRHPVRNDTGVIDVRARPMVDPGWEMALRMSWDGDQFSLADMTNLMMRVGLQVGIGEGRHDSKDSAGMGWGTFEVKRVAVIRQPAGVEKGAA